MFRHFDIFSMTADWLCVSCIVFFPQLLVCVVYLITNLFITGMSLDI